MDVHMVEISFPLEYQAPQWKYKPANFISHLLGHEGPGSLLSYLKNKRWATGVSTGPQGLARGFAMFKLTINMTKLGFRAFTSFLGNTLFLTRFRKPSVCYPGSLQVSVAAPLLRF
jgi:insulysin